MRKEKALPDSRNCLRRAFLNHRCLHRRLILIYSCASSAGSLASSSWAGSFSASRAFMLRLIFLSFSFKVNNLRRNLLTDGKNIGGLRHMLSGDLGNMKQSVNARLQLYKRAEIGHTGNLSGYHGSNRIFLAGVRPRIGLRELHGKSEQSSAAYP